jgi:hypothetical protein
MRSMQKQLGVLGTISAFAYGHRETKKNLCRGGRIFLYLKHSTTYCGFDSLSVLITQE